MRFGTWLDARNACLDFAEKHNLFRSCGVKPQLMLWLAVLWWLAISAYCFHSWLSKGCRFYMPFISDMGLKAHLPVVFLVGTTVEGLLLGLWLLWSTIARCNILKTLRLRLFILEFLCAIAGIACVTGTFFIGFVPWDTYSYSHFACASAVFWGGCFYSFFTCLLCQGISCEYCLKSLGPHSQWRTLYTWLTPLCGA